MDLTTIIVGAFSALAIAHMLTYGRRGRRWGRIGDPANRWAQVPVSKSA
jgi:hypothetical protein